MKNSVLASVAVVALASCAQMAGGYSAAEQQCINLARNDGLRIVRVEGVDTVGGGQNVRLRLEDTFGRGFNATCASAPAGQARWAEPLPRNAVRG
jgi:hypothetical protein